MPDASQASSDLRVAQAGESYLKTTAFPAWLSIFCPRPNFQLSTGGRKNEWLEWVDDGRLHGLAAFRTDADGLVERDPIKTIPRRKRFGRGRC